MTASLGVVNKPICKLNLTILQSYCADINNSLQQLFRYKIFWPIIKKEFIFPRVGPDSDWKIQFLL